MAHKKGVGTSRNCRDSNAKRLGVKGRSKMKKKELVDAIQKSNNKKTADARKK